MPRVIAVDGPAASGKSSTAQAVARRLGWAHLDSGALYRAITLAGLENLGNNEEGAKGKGGGWGPQRIIALTEDLPVRLVLAGAVFRPEVAGVDVAEAIRSERVTRRVSEIAAIPEVRHWVNVRQREAALDYPQGVVVEGRDIGTVVFPDAPLKVFLTASPEERARRRLAQRGEAGGAGGSDRTDPDELRRETEALAARDHADSNRAVAPLRAAPCAILLDTTDLAVEGRVKRVLALAQTRFSG